MSQKIKSLGPEPIAVCSQAGFSLIEAMVASLIMAITFVGVYSMTAMASTSMKNSVDRQKMQIVANQMLEVMNSDYSNIYNYNNMDFTTCNTAQNATTAEVSRYKWCRTLNGFLGTAATGDTRKITIYTTSEGKIVNITLESRNKAAQVIIKNLYE